jgi:hypothetical protein
MTKKVTTIDITPTWRAILPILVDFIANGTAEQKDFAVQELAKLANAVDAQNAAVKK